MKPPRIKIWEDAEVASLRAQHVRGEVSPTAIARQWRVSVETVRRMLRGETYTSLEAKQAAEPDMAGLAAAAALLAAPETSNEGVAAESALARFLAATQAEQAAAKAPDRLIKEIFDDKRMDSVSNPSNPGQAPQEGDPPGGFL